MHESHASPILKSTYALLQLTTRILAGFTRDFKYSLGDKLRNEVETIRDVANSYFGILGHSESWRERTRLANILKGHGHIISLQADHMFSERIPI